ncbi:hypothetical protein BC628DRAFT_301709 [Trametes gibbosa]|nr:hypothetical protein BC628DRAFT_301709 [Trametes gibbosa]
MSTPWRDAAPAPRGPYPPFPHAPPPPPLADNPFAGVNRQPFYAAPVPGFYSPALAQPAPGLPVGHSMPAPAFPRPELPPSLMPGHKSTYSVARSQSDDYFFKGDARPIFPNYTRQPRASFGNPPVPRKPDLSNPPLPPKPQFSPHGSASHSSPPIPYARAPRASSYPAPESSFQPSAPPLPPPVNHEDDAVLHRVLEMSAQESERQRQESMRSEQEQLSLALEASLHIRPNGHSSADVDGRSSFLFSSPEQRPAAFVHSPVIDISFSALREHEHPRGSSRPHVTQQIRDDEALALQLAQEEEQLAERERAKEPGHTLHRGSSASAHSRQMSQMAGGNDLPQYDHAATSPHTVASPELCDAGFASQQQNPCRQRVPRQSSRH